MVEHTGVWDRMVEPMRQPMRDYVALIRTLAGENAKELTLFGSIATASFDAGRHTARNVLVMKQVDLDMLHKLAEEGTRLGKAGIAAPLVMTPEYIKASLDTFPLELIEIQQCHLTVFGEDHFEGLAFDDADVRLQCERELKAILIGLRQGLLAAAGRRKFLSALEMDVGAGLTRTLRGMLWLRGEKEGKPAPEVLAQAEKVFERKLDGIRTALNPNAEHGWAEFERLYRDVEALEEIVDAW